MKVGTVDRNQIKRDKAKSSNVESLPVFLLKKGVTHLRVLPPHPDAKLWYVTNREHWVGGLGLTTCPRQVEEACPVCEKGESLYQERTEESMEEAVKLRPREQHYYNVIVFDEDGGDTNPLNGVQVLRVGKQVHEQLVDLDEDFAGGWGDITNLEKGFDVRIAREGEGRINTKYIVKGVPNSPMLKDSLATHNVSIDTLELNDLSKWTTPLEYEELKRRFENQQVAPGFPAGPRMPVREEPLTPDFGSSSPESDEPSFGIAPPTVE